MSCCTLCVQHPWLHRSCVSCSLHTRTVFPCFSCHSTSSRWPMTLFVLIPVERQQGGATQKSLFWNFIKVGFFLIRKNRWYWKMEHYIWWSLSCSLTILVCHCWAGSKPRLLSFKLGISWRWVWKSRAQCVFGLVVHVVQCHAIWLSRSEAQGSNPYGPDPCNKWHGELLVHKSLSTAFFYKKDAWFAPSCNLEENLNACFFFFHFGCLFRWTLLLNQNTQKIILNWKGVQII